MTKKLCVIILSVILCLAVVGGCFAAYIQTVENKEITFGGEEAITLGIEGSLNFKDVKLSPTTTSATQEFKLIVNTPSTREASDYDGKSGLFVVELTGGLTNTLDMTVTVDGTALESKADAAIGGKSASATYALNELPNDVSITLALPEGNRTPSGFYSVANQSANIKVRWEIVDWAPVQDAYYIAGSMSGWGINQNAIILNGVVPEPTDGTQKNLAQLEGVSLKAGQEFKIRQYKAGQASNEDWATIGSTETGFGIPTDCMEVVGDWGGGNIKVTKDGIYNIYVNHQGLVYIAKSTPAA